VNHPGLFYVFLAAATLFRFAYSGWFELSLDEAYYWVWSNHLDLSYYDHPPMVAYLIAATTPLAESERWVRLGAVLCASGITWLVYLIARDVFNSVRAGFAAAILLNLTPILALGALVITPDSPLCLFWTLALYYGHKIVDTQKPEYWYALGLAFGLAMLSKYNAALFAPAFLLFLLCSAENRHWLLRREPYLAFALSMILFLPVMYWNWTHGWVSFRFQLSHGFDPDLRIAKNFAEFWGGQAGAFGLFLFFFIVVSAVGVGWMGVKRKRDDFMYLFFMSAPLLVFFMVNSLRTRMEGNWSIPAYIAAIAATPGFLALYRDTVSGARAKLAGGGYAFAAWFAAALLVYGHVQIVEPVFPMPQKHEISRRIYGWKTLGAEADKRLADMGGGAFIVANRYQISTLLSYYTAGHREAYITGGRGRFTYLGSALHLTGKNALYVSETGRTDLALLEPYFERIEPAGGLTVTRRGQLIREFVFFKCYNYRGGLIEI